MNGRGTYRHKAVIGLGSNIDPERNIDAAVDRITRDHKIIATASRQYTAPIGFTDQADFLNTAVYIATTMTRDELVVYLKSLENELGRIRTGNKFGPRTIDLDIVVWDGSVVDGDVTKRDFLKQQVHELLPDLPV